MTTYTTNFGSYTADVQPSDWTARWVTTNSTWAAKVKSEADGGKTLEHTSTAAARRLLSWDAIDADANRANVEIVARCRTSDFSAGTKDQLRLFARASGAAAAETAYFVILDGDGFFILNKYTAGTSAAIASVAYTPLINTWYYIRFRVNGTSLKARIWRDGEAEPSTWTVEGSDSGISAAGWVGLGNSEDDGTRDFDYIGVGSDGDTAPIDAGADTIARVTQVLVEAISQVDPKTRVTQVLVEALSSNDDIAAATQQPVMFIVT